VEANVSRGRSNHSTYFDHVLLAYMCVGYFDLVRVRVPFCSENLKELMIK